MNSARSAGGQAARTPASVPGRSRRPAVVVAATRLTCLLLAVGAVGAVVCLANSGDLTQGVGTSVDDTRRPPSFGPVVAVLDVTVSAIVLVLLLLFLGGHGWARHSLALALGLTAFGTLATLLTDPPAFAVVFAVVTALLEVGIVWLLYRPDVGRFVVA